MKYTDMIKVSKIKTLEISYLDGSLLGIMARVGFGSGHHYFIFFLTRPKPDPITCGSKYLDPYPT
jgi:hypothetical protein